MITDTAIQNKYSHYQIARLAIKGRADIIQLRDKSLSTSELIQVAIRIAALCRKHNVTFLINDRVDVALVSDADGVHLGLEDIPIKEARKLLGKNKIIGGTAHSLAEAKKCEKEGADYVGYGHIYPTKTKFKPEKPKGTQQLKSIVSKISVPVIAIGGISPVNIGKVTATGVHGAAVIGAVLNSSDPISTLKKLRKEIYVRKK
ncbi:MAG TPA: thiamine phosphate synthase [Chitinophagaceae bacterium]|nr:thiamine phosphate synthase [Chitinophagaceae bacterium]